MYAVRWLTAASPALRRDRGHALSSPLGSFCDFHAANRSPFPVAPAERKINLSESAIAPNFSPSAVNDPNENLSLSTRILIARNLSSPSINRRFSHCGGTRGYFDRLQFESAAWTARCTFRSGSALSIIRRRSFEAIRARDIPVNEERTEEGPSRGRLWRQTADRQLISPPPSLGYSREERREKGGGRKIPRSNSTAIRRCRFGSKRTR